MSTFGRFLSSIVSLLLTVGLTLAAAAAPWELVKDTVGALAMICGVACFILSFLFVAQLLAKKAEPEGREAEASSVAGPGGGGGVRAS